MSNGDSSNAFLGRGWCFPPSFDLTNGEIEMVSGECDIDQSLRILLATMPGERVMDPTFGCGIKAMVFDTINATLVARIKKRITDAVLFFESRVNLHGVTVDEKDQLEGVLQVTLDYSVISTNTRRNLVYPFYILEGTDVGS